MPGWMRRSAKVEALENGGGPGGLSLPGGRGRSRVKSEPGIKQEEGGGWEEDEGEVRRGGRRNSDVRMPSLREVWAQELTLPELHSVFFLPDAWALLAGWGGRRERPGL